MGPHVPFLNLGQIKLTQNKIIVNDITKIIEVTLIYCMKSKDQVITHGWKLGIMFEKTWNIYEGWREPQVCLNVCVCVCVWAYGGPIHISTTSYLKVNSHHQEIKKWPILSQTSTTSESSHLSKFQSIFPLQILFLLLLRNPKKKRIKKKIKEEEEEKEDMIVRSAPR